MVNESFAIEALGPVKDADVQGFIAWPMHGILEVDPKYPSTTDLSPLRQGAQGEDLDPRIPSSVNEIFKV